MNTKITVLTTTFIHGDDERKHHTVRVNDINAYNPFYHLPDAKSAAFNEACKASLIGSVTIQEVEI